VGPTWARHKSYASLREFQSELGLDAGSQALDPAFADTLQLTSGYVGKRWSWLRKAIPKGRCQGSRSESRQLGSA